MEIVLTMIQTDNQYEAQTNVPLAKATGHQHLKTLMRNKMKMNQKLDVQYLFLGKWICYLKASQDLFLCDFSWTK